MSETIADKLLIKPNSTVWLNEPAHLPLLTPMPEGVREVGVLATAGTAVLFVDSAEKAREQLAEHQADLDKPGAVWLAYSQGDAADLDPDTLGPVIAGFGMQPEEQVVIDERWSALRFRREQPGEGRQPGGAG